MEKLEGKNENEYMSQPKHLSFGCTRVCVSMFMFVVSASSMALSTDQAFPPDTTWTFSCSSSGLLGEGILISSEAAELLDFIDAQGQVHVIQKYLERPLLLEPGHRKFDIR